MSVGAGDSSIHDKQKTPCYLDVSSAILVQARFHETLHTSEDRQWRDR
jgi:hypothetical protein